MTTHSFPRTEIKYPEIVFGIVSPVGTNIAATIAELKGQLTAKGYDVCHIKISDRFQELARRLQYSGLRSASRFDRVSTYISFGDYLRKTFGNAFLAALAISEIAFFRQSGDQQFSQKAYIVDQLKTEDELELLREVYGACFLQLSIYSARDIRVDHLSQVMARDEKKRDKNSYRDRAEKLVVIDEDELAVQHGQKVGKIFQLADVVINADIFDDLNNVPLQVERFVELLFQNNGYSPNRLEYGMYLAHSAALRSLDLSRQVGAAIFRASGEVASLGANEVPKAGGGTYWCDDPFDAREFKLGSDSNDARKTELLNEVLEIVLGKEFELKPDTKKQLDASQFMDALEYGRIVHAEMSALSDAARLGISVAGGTLYCTTFPCHMCSKHIVASGLRKLVFLEPYPKSLTSDLHSDAVSIEGTSRGKYSTYPAVEFVPFFGITPRRYREFFYRKKRKSGGEFEPYHKGEARPFISIMAPWYGRRESEIIEIFNEKLPAAKSITEIFPTEVTPVTD
ncbi:anti-phage dCTP deaminase [Ensifer sp. LC163]|uniref:anti-phage dCTP deaminase n=1 Tax=Ensifer sp. LC163 TaxID=1120652 RepID=UPI000812F1F6|nr:anti-phage dCTP deaminase [Ensifer sp. LC163]OCP36727.1 hypothetical protein BC360_05045 [Ensifer sp. LC163]